jgi:radical SAM superfamily enzyme YgiQ (UPF0313 family)
MRPQSTLTGMHVLLLATYELGRQPFGLASPAAWLRGAEVRVSCLDLAVQPLDDELAGSVDAVGFYLPMHTATRIAAAVLPRVRELNPGAALFAFGLYAPFAEENLRPAGVKFFVGGEFEARVTSHVLGLRSGAHEQGAYIDLDRLNFHIPDRAGLPGHSEYAQLFMPDGTKRTVATTEASRGCKHLCRHCPIVPVYAGKFRIVEPGVVLADIAQQVAAGATHVTFGDPDFFNGRRHAAHVVTQLHAEFPDVSYDVTIKVEHLLKHDDLLPLLRDTGCVLVTSAVEALDAQTLRILDKGHTGDDFSRVVRRCREVGLNLQPTFLPFTPWTTLEHYAELLQTLVRLDLVGQVAPIQLAIRLLIPRGSRLLELPSVVEMIGSYDDAAFGYAWRHEDPAVDALQTEIEAIVAKGEAASLSRAAIFARIWHATSAALGDRGALSDLAELVDRVTIPYLTEPWYC